MKTVWERGLWVWILAVTLIACQPSTIEPNAGADQSEIAGVPTVRPTETAAASPTPIPTFTPLSTAVPTVVPTETGTPLPTSTLLPTATLLPTETPLFTPTFTSTPLPTVTPTSEATSTRWPTVTPVTPTAEPVVAHLFDTTEIRAYSNEDFSYHLGRLRDTMRMLESESVNISFGQEPTCGNFYDMRSNWTVHLVGYDEVPSEVDGLYFEYRELMRTAAEITFGIVQDCVAGDRSVSEEAKLEIETFLSSAISRSEQMIQELPSLLSP